MRHLKRILTSLACYALISPALHAGPVEQALRSYQEQQINLEKSKKLKTFYFQQVIDHDQPSGGHFAQRYYVDESYSQDDKDPVFFYICGEATCTARALNGAIRDYAKHYHAKLVALEHRYYGESLPFNSLATKHLSVLSTKAALKDLARFQNYMMTQEEWQGRWIAFGGSYPGSLSAYYRLYYPQNVVGALASSAPVMAKEDFYEYDAHINTVVGQDCGEQMRQVTQILEASLNKPEQLAEMKALFSAEEIQDPRDFLYLVADTGAAAVQYGMKNEFCAALSQSTSPLTGYALFAKSLYQRMGLSAVEMTAQGALSENPQDYPQGTGMRQWFYQSCQEYGYWQNANPDPAQATRSALINLDYHHQVCARLFGLHEAANTQAMNAQFYYPLMERSTSKIYFTNGEQDPWSTLSLNELNGNASNPNLSYYLIKGAAHCDDLHSPNSSDSQALKTARQKMKALLGQWLTKAS